MVTLYFMSMINIFNCVKNFRFGLINLELLKMKLKNELCAK